MGEFTNRLGPLDGFYPNFVWVPSMTYITRPDYDSMIKDGLQHTDEGVALLSRFASPYFELFFGLFDSLPCFWLL